jgi:hypothetical protein
MHLHNLNPDTEAPPNNFRNKLYIKIVLLAQKRVTSLPLHIITRLTCCRPKMHTGKEIEMLAAAQKRTQKGTHNNLIADALHTPCLPPDPIPSLPIPTLP